MRALAMLWLPLLAGCSAMLAPGRFQVVVDSQPPGASVLHEGEEVGVTPCTVKVSRDSREFELRLLGYHTQQVDVGTERNPWVAGNLVTLGFGMFVDEALGTSVNPITAPLVVRMAPANGPVWGAWRRELPRRESHTPSITGPGTALAHLLVGLAQLCGAGATVDPSALR